MSRRYRPEYDPNTGQAFADPSTYKLTRLPPSTATGAVLASAADDDAPEKPTPRGSTRVEFQCTCGSLDLAGPPCPIHAAPGVYDAYVRSQIPSAALVPEEGTPVRRKSNPSEIVTRPKQGITRPARQPGTTMLPAAYDVPEHVPLEPTTMLPAAYDAPERVPPGSVDGGHEPTDVLEAPTWPPEPDSVDGVTTVMPSAELEAAEEPEEIFDRVAWVADRLTSCADALGADGRPRTAALLKGLAAGMTMGPMPTALERVGSRLIQRTLLADADVADVDDDAIARLLMDMAADVLVGVEPTRKAARAIARQLDERATECRKTAERCRQSGNMLGVEHHNARADELAVQAREIRKAHR